MQTRRIHPAGKSHLGRVGCWVAGLELVAELDEIALSLALSSASRWFSLSINVQAAFTRPQAYTPQSARLRATIWGAGRRGGACGARWGREVAVGLAESGCHDQPGQCDPKALGRRTLAALQPAGEGRDLGRGVVALEQLQQGQPSD
jgi:hypothetical protein